jgi:signal transduction histidine kinase
MGALDAITEFGRRALTGRDLTSLLQEGVALVHRELRVDRCDLISFSSKGEARMRAVCDNDGSRADDTVLEIHPDSPASQVLLLQAPVVIDDFRAKERLAPPAAHEVGIVSSLNVPLYGQGRLSGVLGAHTRRLRIFSSDETEWLQLTAHLLSAALERSLKEDRRREERMLRAEQMMAIGQVAAGVAHELRNPLTSIKGLIQVNLREAAARGFPSEDLVVIEHEIRRMERTLQTFLDFARPPKPHRRPLCPAQVVERVFSLVAGRAQKQKVALRSIGQMSLIVDADQDQLQQLLLNLVLNSLDAMHDGGTIEIDVRPPRDGFVDVVIRDSGPGIPDNVLPKIFETFVSSKETGVGLGLPVSRRIAEDHGGTLGAYNLPGGGACFVLKLPCPQ